MIKVGFGINCYCHFLVSTSCSFSFSTTFEASELFSPTVKLILLQNAVRNVSDLRIIETLDEFQSTTQGHGKSTNIKYVTYYEPLINACVRSDKTPRANLGKRSNIYTTFTQNVEIIPGNDQFSPENPWESSFQGIDTHSNEFYNISSTTAHYPGPPSPVNLPRMPPNTPNQPMNPMMNPHYKPQK